jgi:hypothetical protein
MIIPLPPDGAGEFRAIKRELPKLLVRLLLFFTSFYGLFITLSVPWTLRAVIFDEIRSASMGPLAYVWGGMLLTFGTALMVRGSGPRVLGIRQAHPERHSGESRPNAVRLDHGAGIQRVRHDHPSNPFAR